MKIDFENEFENVYLFVSDALRYDAVPEALSDETIIKAVSSSPLSCTAFSSLVSGRYPPQHGVWRFSDLISSDLMTLYDLFPGECPSYNGVAAIVDSIENAVGYETVEAFTDAVHTAEAPFFVLDREMATHAPYGIDVEGSEAEKMSVLEEYWTNRDIEQVRADYREGARMSAQRFEARLDLLRDRGLLEDTLVIFTADHGEALGEGGLFSHSAPVISEVAYVPVVFYSDGVSVSGEFMAHVDVLPTIAAAMGESYPSTVSGRDLTEGAPESRLAFNAFAYNRGAKEWSGWDRSGGHTFTNRSLLDRLRAFAGKFTSSRQSPLVRERPMHPPIDVLRSGRVVGTPEHSRADAREFCESIRRDARESKSQDLEDEAKAQLKALGYMDEQIE